MTAQLPIGSIRVPGVRMRPLGDVSALAESIAQNGLLNPITVTRDGTLISGLHRLEACKLLGWTEIPANITDLEGLRAELAEIDENLVRSELTVLQQAEHLARRVEILEGLGLRAKAGDNQHTAGGETVSPPHTTAEIAAEMGISERSAQQRLQIARKLTSEAKDAVKGTDLENSTTRLLEIARLAPDQQVAGVYRALHMSNPDAGPTALLLMELWQIDSRIAFGPAGMQLPEDLPFERWEAVLNALLRWFPYLTDQELSSARKVAADMQAAAWRIEAAIDARIVKNAKAASSGDRLAEISTEINQITKRSVREQSGVLADIEDALK